MITSLRIVDFKNFADETLHLGPFTVIVGANASGKSNIRDAFRFLHGIGRGYTLEEIFGGKDSAGWQPIRGAANEIMRFAHDQFCLEVEMQSSRLTKFGVEGYRYSIRIRRDAMSGGQFRVLAESLEADPRTSDSTVPTKLYTSGPPPASEKGTQGKGSKLLLHLSTGNPIELAADQPVLVQDDAFQDETRDLGEAESNDVEWMRNSLARKDAYLVSLATRIELFAMRLLELSPERMREPSLPGASRLGDSGDKLPAVLEAICADPKRKSVLLSWLHELTPMDVSNLEFPIDLNGRVNLRIREAGGRRVSAYSASDGTLRFLGILAALLNEDDRGLYFFEEIDNGIHPARLHLLLDLIERQTAKGKIQVVATTHSPDVLNLISDATFENAVVVYRDEDSADAIIRRVADLPNVRELRKTQGLGRLHTAGWMEDILAFSGMGDEDGKGGD